VEDEDGKVKRDAKILGVWHREKGYSIFLRVKGLEHEKECCL